MQPMLVYLPVRRLYVSLAHVVTFDPGDPWPEVTLAAPDATEEGTTTALTIGLDRDDAAALAAALAPLVVNRHTVTL